MTNSAMERLEFKAAFTTDDTGQVEGKAWDFSSPDRVGDVIEPAAFANAIGKSLPMLFAHNQEQVVGTWDAVTVDADGLKVKGRLLVDDVARAREVRALLRAKSVTGLSVGFMTKKAAPRKGGGRTISDLDLVEVSLVAVPAHPGAQISQVKDMKLTTENALKTEVAEVEVKAADLKAANDNIADLTKRLEAAETKLARPAIIGNAANEPTDESKAFGAYLRHGQQAPAEELKALTVSNDEQGGYLAPAEMATEFIRDLVEYSPIRSVASVRNIVSPSVKYPKRTGITNAQWESENEDSAESTVTFGQLEATARKLMTYVDISNELLADSGGTAEAEVRLALAEDFGQKEGLAFVSGDGVKQPEGLMTNADILNTVNGHATVLAADPLITLMYAQPAAYRNNGTWMMNGTTLATVRKLKDGNGNYLWQPSYQAGQPENLLGRPVIEAVDMPDIASGEYPIIFGDFSAYRIVDRLAMSILVNPYLLATKGLTRIHATRRTGGRVMQAARFRKLKMAV